MGHGANRTAAACGTADGDSWRIAERQRPRGGIMKLFGIILAFIGIVPMSAQRA